jgi:hypothetical protein
LIRQSSGDGLEPQFQAAAGRVDFPDAAAQAVGRFA